MADRLADPEKSSKPKHAKDCIFCKIAAKEQETMIIYEDDDTIAFRDLRPATEHHYLVIPKGHYGNPKSLKRKDLNVVENLLAVGRTVLEKQNANTEDTRIGFHWPPFNSVQHLHLHVINPASELRFTSRHIYRPGSWWFVTVDWMIDHIRKMKPAVVDTNTDQRDSEEPKE